MRNPQKIFTLMLFSTLPLPVGAQEPTGPGSAEPEKAAITKDRRVCKKVKATGTRITQRVCMKQSKWDEAALKDKEAMDVDRIDGGPVRVTDPDQL